jgi:hypothetical protein
MKPIRRWEVLERMIGGHYRTVREVDCAKIPRQPPATPWSKPRPYPLVREVASGIVYRHGQQVAK